MLTTKISSTFTASKIKEDVNMKREGFRIQIRREEDAREGFQDKVTVWIDNTGHGLPALSIEELEVLRDELSKYINQK